MGSPGLSGCAGRCRVRGVTDIGVSSKLKVSLLHGPAILFAFVERRIGGYVKFSVKQFMTSSISDQSFQYFELLREGSHEQSTGQRTQGLSIQHQKKILEACHHLQRQLEEKAASELRPEKKKEERQVREATAVAEQVAAAEAGAAIGDLRNRINGSLAEIAARIEEQIDTYRRMKILSITVQPVYGGNMTQDSERICANCRSFFPDSLGFTDFGICLADPAFEPYIDELIDHGNFDVCRQLIEKKRFSGDREACPEYDEVDFPDPEEDILEEMGALQFPDPGDAPSSSPKYAFQDHSFAWLLEHDARLRDMREWFRNHSAEDRRMAADYEYHSGPARDLFDQLIEREKESTNLPSHLAALAIDPDYAPAILTVGTHEYLLGRVAEAMDLLLSLVPLPPDTEDLAIIIDKAGIFLVGREDYVNALKLYEAAAATFPDEPLFQAGLSFCRQK